MGIGYHPRVGAILAPPVGRVMGVLAQPPRTRNLSRFRQRFEQSLMLIAIELVGSGGRFQQIQLAPAAPKMRRTVETLVACREEQVDRPVRLAAPERDQTPDAVDRTEHQRRMTSHCELTAMTVEKRTCRTSDGWQPTPEGSLRSEDRDEHSFPT